MEDLDNSFGKSHIKDKNNNDVNFNRIVSNLNLSSLKQMMEQKQAGPNSLKDNNEAGQPRSENVQGGRSGVVNEQR